MVAVEKSSKKPRISAIPLKVKREGIQKKVTSKNPEKPLRGKRSTIDSHSHAFEQAKEFQANLPLEFPSLIKSMLPSHVSGGFWLGLPKHFCEKHLAKANTMIVLEDENGNEYITKYLTDKVGLSGGWRGFSLAHNLVEGDVLVFQLVHPSKFKVYIIRSLGPNELDGALSLLYLDDCKKEHDSENDPNNSQMICCDVSIPTSDQLEYISEQGEDCGSEVMNGIKLSESMITFREVTSIEKFSILVNGLIIDSEFSKHEKIKYYELCCSQRMFLHEHLLEGLNYKLIAGMMSETINIADAIRASKITTPSDSFAVWHKTLKAFEVMGMSISFLLARLDQLMSLASKSKRYIKARLEREQAEKEKKALEIKLEEVKGSIKRLDDEIDSQDLNLERLGVVFQDMANSPW